MVGRFRERESKGKTAMGARDRNLWEICPRRKALSEKRKECTVVGSMGGRWTCWMQQPGWEHHAILPQAEKHMLLDQMWS